MNTDLLIHLNQDEIPVFVDLLTIKNRHGSETCATLTMKFENGLKITLFNVKAATLAKLVMAINQQIAKVAEHLDEKPFAS